MDLYKNRYRIESTRLKNWDYSSCGYYFVTICTKNRECLFGNIVPAGRDDPSGRLYIKVKFIRFNHWAVQICYYKTNPRNGLSKFRLAIQILRSHYQK